MKIQYTTHNGRFCEMAAVPPQKVTCEFGSYYPAERLVVAATTPSCRALGASGGQRGGKWLRNQDVSSKQPDLNIN